MLTFEEYKAQRDQLSNWHREIGRELSAIIERYAMKLSEHELTPKALNSLMVLKLLIASGDDMPHDENSAESFQKAYRSWGVIYSRSLGSYDSVMWNLMHLDLLIWEVLEEEGIV